MVTRISPAETRALLDDQGYQYVDVRSEPEYAAGHPKGALNVPIMLAGPAGLQPNPRFLEVMEKLFQKDAKLVLGCRSGQRSLRAAEMLVAAGFSNIVDQRAGYDGSRNAFGAVTEPGWVAAGLPTETITELGSYAELIVKVG